MKFLEKISKKRIEEMKGKIKIEDDSSMQRLYSKYPKTSIELAMLFNYCIEILKLSGNKEVNKYLAEADGLSRLAGLVEEHDRSIAFGRNAIYNEIQAIVNINRDDIVEFIVFVFSELIGEEGSKKIF